MYERDIKEKKLKKEKKQFVLLYSVDKGIYWRFTTIFISLIWYFLFSTFCSYCCCFQYLFKEQHKQLLFAKKIASVISLSNFFLCLYIFIFFFHSMFCSKELQEFILYRSTIFMLLLYMFVIFIRWICKFDSARLFFYYYHFVGRAQRLSKCAQEQASSKSIHRIKKNLNIKERMNFLC